MVHEPNYYDSQASAAAALSVSVFEVKAAKRAGCRAFRSGRVYRAELVEWLKANPIRRSGRNAADETNGEQDYFSVPDVSGWKDRREMLFALRDLLDYAYAEGQISAAEYRRLGDKTVPTICKLSVVWNAGIDLPGYLSGWLEIKAKLPRC